MYTRKTDNSSGFWSAILLVTMLFLSQSARAGCQGELAVQVLGSGGPIANSSRASAGYVVWIDGRSRLLVDAGGGTFARFGNAKADTADLDVIALTHLHADHAAELPAYFKSAWFGERTRPLQLLGPTGAGDYPDIEEFLDSLIGSERGAFRYLNGYLHDEKGYFAIHTEKIDHTGDSAVSVFRNDNFSLKAVGVSHGPVPALGYLVEARGRRIAFSGDQNGNNPPFSAMIRHADVLIMDHAVPEDADDTAAGLHARPSEIASLAKAAGVERLVLSHLMPRSEQQLEKSLTLIAKQFGGQLDVAEDLMCIEIPVRKTD